MRQAPAQSSNSDGIATGEKAVIDSMEKLTDAIGKLIDTERSPRGRRDSSSQSPQPRTAPPTTRPAPQAQAEQPDASILERALGRVLPTQLVEMFGNLRQTFTRSATTETATTAANAARNLAGPARAGQAAHHSIAGAGTGAMTAEAATAARAIAALGPPALAAAAVIAIAKMEFDALNGALKTATSRLRDFSPDIQRVDAQTEMRRAQTSIRRAQEFGPALANVQASRDRLADAIDRLGFAVFAPILKIVERSLPLIEAIARGVETTSEGVEAGVAGINVLTAVAQEPLGARP